MAEANSIQELQIPWDGLLHLLRQHDFDISAETYAEVNRVLAIMVPDSHPDDLAFLLAPIVAKSEEQQAKFYQIYEQFAKQNSPVQLEDASLISSDKEKTTENTNKVLGLPVLVFWGLVTLIVSFFIKLIPVIQGASLEEFENVNQISLAIALSLVLIFAIIFYQRKQVLLWFRKLFQKKSSSQPLPGPYAHIPAFDPPDIDIFPPQESLRFADPFRNRKYMSFDTARVDVPRTVQESVKQAGLVQVRYQETGFLPEYVLLIDETYAPSHEVAWFNYLVEMLQQQGVKLERYYYNHQPQLVWEEGRAPISLDRLYAGQRLLLFGRGEGLIDYLQGGLFPWAEEILSTWNQVGILSPKHPREWGAYEATLDEFFPIAPATVEGIMSVIDAFDNKRETAWWEWLERKQPVYLREPTAERLKLFLPAPLFTWVCACALYPELDWKLTLRFAQALEQRDADLGLLQPDNLALLTQIEWFRQGHIPHPIRQDLITYVDQDTFAYLQNCLNKLYQEEVEAPETDHVGGITFALYKLTNAAFLTKDLEEKAQLRKDILLLRDRLPTSEDVVLNGFIEQALQRNRRKELSTFIANSRLAKALQQVLFNLSIISFSLNRRQDIRRWQKNLSPYWSRRDIENALTNFVETRFQTIPPSNFEEIMDSSRLSVSEKAIDFFLKTVFRKKNDSSRFFLILGDAGMGATTFLLNLYARYKKSGNAFSGGPRFRIYLFPLGYPNVLSEIEKVEDPRNSILLLDGLAEDALAVRNLQRRLAQILDRVQEFRFVVFTCRTQFFSNESAIPTETRIINFGPGKGFHSFTTLYLSPLNEKDIDQYLTKKYGWFQRQKRTTARKIIAQAPSLFVRPLGLTYLDVLIEANQPFQSHFQIYESLIQSWIQREANRVQEERRKTFTQEMFRFSQLLAVEMYQKWTPGRSLLIEGNDLPAFAAKYRIQLEEIELTSRSLLNRNAQGQYKFSHKSVLEYFLAKEAFENPEFQPYLEGFDMGKTFLDEMTSEGIASSISFDDQARKKTDPDPIADQNDFKPVEMDSTIRSLKESGAHVVFSFGAPASGKTSFLSTIYWFLSTNSKWNIIQNTEENFRTIKRIQELVIRFNDKGLLPYATSPGVIHELDLILQSTVPQSPQKLFTFLDMSGEYLVSFSEEGQLDGHYARYLEVENTILYFVPFDQRVEEDFVLKSFLDFIANSSTVNTKRIAIIITKWDKNNDEKGSPQYEHLAKYLERKMRVTWNSLQHLDYNHSLDINAFRFSIGEIQIDDSGGQKLIGGLNTEYCQKIVEWLYQDQSTKRPSSFSLKRIRNFLKRKN